MIRKIWNEYRRSFCLEKYKKVSKNQEAIALAYIVIVTLLNKDFYTMICLWSIGIPLVFGALSAKLVPMRLNKMMFLSPMSGEERRKYIVASYLFRTGISILVEVATILILVVEHMINPAFGICVFYVYVTVMLTCNMQIDERMEQKEQRKQRKTHLKENQIAGFYVWNAIVFGSGIVVMIMLYSFSDEGMKLDDPMVMAYTLVAIIWQTLITVRAMRYFKPAVSIAMDYEKTNGLEQEDENAY